MFSPLWFIDPDGNFIPDLAREVPTIENGGLSADGLTWKIKLRSDVKWHDGTPFTSKDVRFSWEFTGNADVPIVRRAVQTQVSAIDTPDDYTVVMHWKQLDARANAVSRDELYLYPEHIIRPLFASTPSCFQCITTV